MKRILCYGDSNTWGFVPASMDWQTFAFDRYDENTRWPGVLANELGVGYQVIEEGLNGRNTVFDDPFAPPGVNLNGSAILPTILMTHWPLDMVILKLGTNDLKNYHGANASLIANGLRQLIMKTKAYAPNAKILVLAPPPIVNGYDFWQGAFDELSQEQSHLLAAELQRVCELEGCDFFNVADVAAFSELDGIHYDEQAHHVLAATLLEKVKQIV